MMVVNVNDEMVQVPTKVSGRSEHCMVSNILSGDLILVSCETFRICFEIL